MTYVKENNFEEASIVSSGNAALSAALYAKIYGIPLTCYVPKRTSKQKTDIIDTFGAKYHLIGDTYEEAYYHLLNNPPKNALNITSGVLSARSDGSKTIAYEIWEDLQGVPDVVVCPAGNGSLLSAVYHGFSDLKNWGFTDRIPAMISVQISGADPINQAFEQNQWIKDIKDPADSICEAIVASESYCSPRAVYAMRDSGGFGISLTDKQIIKGAKYAVNVEGIFPEISSASVFAAYLENEKEIKQKGDTVVLINSGTSLKDVAQVRDVLVSNSSEKSCFFYKNNA
jgi:threonine synthase